MLLGDKNFCSDKAACFKSASHGSAIIWMFSADLVLQVLENLTVGVLVNCLACRNKFLVNFAITVKQDMQRYNLNFFESRRPPKIQLHVAFFHQVSHQKMHIALDVHNGACCLEVVHCVMAKTCQTVPKIAVLWHLEAEGFATCHQSPSSKFQNFCTSLLMRVLSHSPLCLKVENNFGLLTVFIEKP